jgi:endonuclease-3 related protein
MKTGSGGVLPENNTSNFFMPDGNPKKFSRAVLMAVYQRLLEAYGPQDWWPADTPFEVVVGSVLTQNTAWGNVEKAIGNLSRHGHLSLGAINRLGHEELAAIIRPSGYFNIKARRLKSLCDWINSQGGMEMLSRRDTEEFREQLLNVNGIGPETADDILLYAFDRPVFVIDAYTRRLFRTLGLIKGDEKYESLRKRFESHLDPDPELFNEYHALIVRHAKEKCTAVPNCPHCRVEMPVVAK